MSESTWALIVHPYIKEERDYKSWVCYKWLKLAGEKHPEYNHVSLMINRTLISITTTGIFFNTYDNINEALAAIGEDNTLAVVFTPTEDMEELLIYNLDDVDTEKLTNRAFLNYALNVYSTEPICVQWVKYVLSLHTATNDKGQPIFKREFTEAPWELAALLLDVLPDATPIKWFNKVGIVTDDADIKELIEGA